MSIDRSLLRAIAFLTVLSSLGCVERKMTIRSVPADADLFLDGERLGKTPIELPFTEYGVREIVLRKPGYRVTRRLVELEEPYFQKLPFDLYYEALTRDLYLDHREYQFVLEPNQPEDLTRDVVDQQMKLADEMRKR